MANAKFIDATTWGNLTEIDVTDGENLFPQLPAGTYRPVLSGVDSVTVPALSAGAIDQATPSEGDTLTVSGSNATGSATYQWQKDGVDISGATSASLDTTGEGAGDYRRGVSDGVQGPVYTSAVTVGAAAAGYLDDFSSYSEGDDPSVDNPSNYTAVGTSIAGTAYVNATLNELTWHPTNTSGTTGTWWTYTGSTLSDDHFVEAVIGSETGDASQYSPYIEFFVRFVDEDNYIKLTLYQNRDARLAKRVGGTDTANLEVGAQSAVSEDDTVKVEVIGDTVKRYRNGVEVGSYTHADLDTGGALESGVTGMRFRRTQAVPPAFVAPISLKSVEFGDA